MLENFVEATYVAAGLLFVLSIAGLARHESARRGNLFGTLGMALAIGATNVAMVIVDLQDGELDVAAYALLYSALAIGGVIGLWRARTVPMTGMPQLVGLLNSFVGLSAVFIGFNAHLAAPVGAGSQHVEVFLGVFVGAVTFSGSVVAWAKLDERIPSRPIGLPGRNWVNLALLLGLVALAWWFISSGSIIALALVAVVSLLLGVLLVLAIGGADMPVVISLLNSYSGIASAFSGFILDQGILVVTGAIVGSSGAILSFIMSRAMNRSLLSVVLGGFGESTGQVADVEGEHRAVSAGDVAELLGSAQKVIVAPGYGMAVAQAQHLVAELTQSLRGKGVDVRFAIHPVAGRLPGHMNVLLAEARVPYDLVHSMDEINDDFPTTDVVLVIGANDTVNPAAMEKGTPISGMPVLHVWEAGTVVVLKRSMSAGYAGVQNPLFFNENTVMCFGDAKATTQAIVSHLPQLEAPGR